MKVSTNPSTRSTLHRAGVRVPYSSNNYTGKELKRFTGRPGAMDAFDLPSREFNTLTYPKHTGKPQETLE